MIIGPHTIVYVMTDARKILHRVKLTESATGSDRGGRSQLATLEAHTIMQT